jgi:hypothetical protein
LENNGVWNKMFGLRFAVQRKDGLRLGNGRTKWPPRWVQTQEKPKAALYVKWAMYLREMSIFLSLEVGLCWHRNCLFCLMFTVSSLCCLFYFCYCRLCLLLYSRVRIPCSIWCLNVEYHMTICKIWKAVSWDCSENFCVELKCLFPVYPHSPTWLLPTKNKITDFPETTT